MNRFIAVLLALFVIVVIICEAEHNHDSSDVSHEGHNHTQHSHGHSHGSSHKHGHGHGHGRGHGRRRRRCETPKLFDCKRQTNKPKPVKYSFNSTTRICFPIPEGKCTFRGARFAKEIDCLQRCANKTEAAIALDTETYEEVADTVTDGAEPLVLADNSTTQASETVSV